MSAPEPTAEHKRLAARLVDDIYDRGSVNPAECRAAEDLIARALAAAEARGAVVAVAGMIGMDPSLGWAAVKAAVADRLQDRRRALDEVAERVKAAEALGFERGRKEGGPVVAAVRALYTLPEFPHGEWSCGECGNVYPRDIICGCPTCSPAARAALYAKEPR